MSVLVVGGGIAGWTAASSLRAGGYAEPITVVESQPALYDRPPLSKSALVTGAPLESLAFATPEECAAQAIDVVTGRRVVAIDAAVRTATLDDGTALTADELVLAPGAAARRPDWPGADDPRVGLLRDYADAVALRAAAAGGRVVVLGAGLIGAEAASGLRALGAEVVLVDRNAVPLVPLVGPTMAAHLHAMHAAHGVEIVRGEVAAVRRGPVDRLAIELVDGRTIDATEVLAGVGCAPRTELAAAAGLEVDGGIVVDAAGRTSAPRIYAGGDATRLRRADGGLAPLAGHWEAAQLDGRAIAAAILGADPPTRGAPWCWSDRYGVHLEAVGRFTGPGVEVVRDGGGHPETFHLDDGLLVGAASVDAPNTVRAARRLIDQRIPVEASSLADPGVPLRGLLRPGLGRP